MQSEGACAVQSTVCMSLLQPQRETYNLFDDVLLLADGESQPHLVYVSGGGMSFCSTASCRRSTWQSGLVTQTTRTACSWCCDADAKCALLAQDILTLSDVAGCLVYHGPREQVVPFFDSLGFKLPPRKGTADFLQEITSKKDQAVCSRLMQSATELHPLGSVYAGLNSLSRRSKSHDREFPPRTLPL